MDLNIANLIQLKESEDYKLIRNILINLKTLAKSGVDEQTLQEYIKNFAHYRLYMKTQYICDTSFSKKNKEQGILNTIINRAANRILFLLEDKYSSIDEIDMTNNCVVVSHEIKDICNELGVDCEIVKIFPGYKKEAKLFNGSGSHYFNIVNIQGKKYLIDLSYKQFFKKNVCFLEEIGVPYLCAPLAGRFMLMDAERENLAKELLQNGYIELKDDALKLYCDGFTISYRNALYYEYFDNTYSTNYTSENYLDFLFGNDSQIDHEPIECLGPLKCKNK